MVSPFALTPYKLSTKRDATLQSTLKSNVDFQLNRRLPGKSPRRVPFSVLLLAQNSVGPHLYAGVDDDQLCFSASLLKPAVLYAAVELLAAANRLVAAQSITDPKKFLLALDNEFDDQITKAAVREIRKQPFDPAPDWETIFDFNAGGSPPVTFKGPFAIALSAMITISHDPSATACIRALGYSYIDGALAAAGLLQLKGRKTRGIWISGDYANNEIRIFGTMNDGLGKLVMDTETMVRLFALVQFGVLTGAAGASTMASLLAGPVTRKPLPFITHADDVADDTKVSVPFTVLLNKLGIDHLGRTGMGPKVSSECSVIEWKTSETDTVAALKRLDLSNRMVICWQNFRVEEAKGFGKIRSVVISTVEQFVVGA